MTAVSNSARSASTSDPRRHPAASGSAGSFKSAGRARCPADNVPGVCMHPNQLDIPVGVVERLVADQFPQWASLPIRPVESAGTVNALFRLGPDLVVRMPFQARPLAEVRRELAAEQANARRLRSWLAVAVPEPVASGEPGRGYPMPWGIYRWLPGRTATPENGGDSVGVARALAGVVRQIRKRDVEGEEYRGTGRGGRLQDHDRGVQDALSRSSHLVDTDALQRMWTRLRDTRRVDEPDVWTHGDLMPGNLLVDKGSLVAVIDVGGLAVRDPAVDLAPAWNLFSASARDVFRGRLQVTQATWDRGRGWSLVQAIAALYYYVDTNPPMAATARRTLEALIHDAAE